MKLDDMLLFENGEVKIADLGWQRKQGRNSKELKLEGLLFIWHLDQSKTLNTSQGLILELSDVLFSEMVTGKPACNSKPGTSMFVLLIRIGEGDEMPIIPEELSQEGKDFLSRILHKDGLLRCFWNILLLLINGKTLFH